MENPRVNILICNNNYEDWVIDAIDSAINQTYPDISITYIDDGSTDSSWKKVCNHLNKSRLHKKILHDKFDIRTCEYVDKKHSRTIPINLIKLDKSYGPAFARNIGIELSIDKSEFQMVLDADDKMYKNKVLRFVEEAMKLQPLIGIVYGDYITHNTENGLEVAEYKQNFDFNSLTRECIIHSGSLISSQALKSVYDQFGFYDVNLRVCEDYDLWIRITKNFLAIHVPECLTFVRVTPKNSTNQVNKDIWSACMNRVIQKNFNGN